MTQVSQDAFLGSLLGLAIGDALGMPVAGWSAEKIAERFGAIREYHLKNLPDGTELKAGEFTDESEIALCLVESLTANHGEFDADNVGARMLYLARGESKRWLGAEALRALTAAEETRNFHVPLDEDGPATGDVGSRGVPIGLLYSVGHFDAAGLRAMAEQATRLTHGSPAAIAATTAVAFAVNIAARGETERRGWLPETAAFLGDGELAERLAEADRLFDEGTPAGEALRRLGTGEAAAQSVTAALYAAAAETVFEESVFVPVNAGGATDTIAAIAGAVAGAAVGASGIPQRLIDEMEGRIYVSLAAPWFYRAAQRRAGWLIDLRPEA